MKQLKGYALMALTLLALCGCKHHYVYEAEDGPLPPTPKERHVNVRFIFDKNMLRQDAFASEVESVRLYILDSAGNVIKNISERGDALKAEGYSINIDDLDLAPGGYSLLAWCGNGAGTHFTIGDGKHHSAITATLGREHDAEGNATSSRCLDGLFHGRTDNVAVGAEGNYDFTVPLVKNTNEFRIVLQRTDGQPIDMNDYTVSVTADNGTIESDNSLRDDETINYFAYETIPGSTETARDGEEEEATYDSSTWCISTSRLVEGEDVRVLVKGTDGEEIVNLSVIELALEAKEGNGFKGDNQEYLDCQDLYELIFPLESEGRSLGASICINDWWIIRQISDL